MLGTEYLFSTLAVRIRRRVEKGNGSSGVDSKRGATGIQAGGGERRGHVSAALTKFDTAKCLEHTLSLTLPLSCEVTATTCGRVVRLWDAVVFVCAEVRGEQRTEEQMCAVLWTDGDQVQLLSPWHLSPLAHIQPPRASPPSLPRLGRVWRRGGCSGLMEPLLLLLPPQVTVEVPAGRFLADCIHVVKEEKRVVCSGFLTLS